MQKDSKSLRPLPLFDALEYIHDDCDYSYLDNSYNLDDIKMAKDFLGAYVGSKGTFNSYRREVERLIHWCALIKNIALSEIKRDLIEEFITFCQNPPNTWIGISKPPRFIDHDGERLPNPVWSPFVITQSKTENRRGLKLDKKNFRLSQGSIRELFVILGSFFNYLIQEEYIIANPITMIRQKSRFIRKTQGKPKIRRLSELQWDYVIKTAKDMAEKNPAIHERTLFIMSSLYSMYLRISELAASDRWQPTMNHFFRDGEGSWWFTTVGKGNKERQIAVSNSMLEALKRWRSFLGLSSLPSPADNTPLLPKVRGGQSIKSTHHVREIVQNCFDEATNQLRQDGFEEEADNLMEATVHWLRHTGISDDVKIRPREHVRDDAGHASGATTDLYIDIELRERHKSARDKEIE